MSAEKNITRKDVAEKAGVSVSVVSRVLNNSGYVDKEKKKKIIKIAEQLGYIPNPIAMALQTRRTYQIIFFCNDLTGAYYNQMYHGMAKTAKERGWHGFRSFDCRDSRVWCNMISEGWTNFMQIANFDMMKNLQKNVHREEK